MPQIKAVHKSFWLWCKSFLTNRTQQVKCLNATNAVSRVEAIPAGIVSAVISPILFNIYFNDMENCIPNELSTFTCKYADDCSQYGLVSIGQNSKVREAVNSLKDWAIQNKLTRENISIGDETIERCNAV